MIDHNWHICADCGASHLVWTRDGDIVCASCGLVKEGHVISDEPEWRKYDDDEPFASTKNRVERLLEEHNQRKASTVYRDILHHFDSSLYECIDDIFEISSPLHIHQRQQKKLFFLAACIFATMRSRWHTMLHPSDICRLLQVPFNQEFWSCFSGVDNILREKRPLLYERLQNCLQSNKDLTTNVYKLYELSPLARKHITDKRLLIRIVNELFEKARNLISSVKLDKFNISLVYIGCKAAGFKVPINEILDVFNISKNTIDVHEHLVQSALQSYSFGSPKRRKQ